MEKINELTGLYSEKAFFEAVEEFLQKEDEKTYCMMAIDVEHFRLYNQLHGMEEGDNLLRFIAEMLRTYRVAQGGVIGYLGGDNFALVTEYNRETLDQLREGIRDEIRRKNNTTGYPPAYGIYTIVDRSESAAVMYHRATLALSYVIGNYTSRVKEYYPDMDGKAEEEIRLLSEIQHGMDNDEFTFFIQPQCDITKGKIVGGESLVRWIKPDKGMISPGLFIPVLEKNGFIADLDRVVWAKVCKWLRDCINRGYKPVPISVNVSRIDIFSLDVPKYLISLVEKYDITPDLLKIEITESAYAEDGDSIVETVNRLRDYGFIVMMDDFGSGYSSLNMLKSVPVDVLKMDMRFLEINENEEEKGVGILESVVNMARQMRIPIVVEGVETQVQENLLRKMGCSYTQGYLYYKPMSIEAFEKILVDDDELDHSGFWYRQAESVHLREFLDTNLFNDTVINNIIGPAIFYDVYENNVEITRVNEQYFQLAGIPRQEEEDYRKRFWNSVRDDDRQLLYSIFAQAYENVAEGASGFINFLRRDGVVLWVNAKVFFLREKDGHRLYYASLTDMTDVKADTIVDAPIKYQQDDFSELQHTELEQYYGKLPSPFGIGHIVFDEDGRTSDFAINYANQELRRMSGGDIERLRILILKLFEGRKEEFLDATYRAAYMGETTNINVYSAISNSYFEISIYQYQQGYACCMMQDVTNTHVYEKVSNNIMTSFREVYYIRLQENHCRMVYPNEDNLLNRGNYEEMINRHFEAGQISLYDEKAVREFLSLENLNKVLRKQNSVEYKYKRRVPDGGLEWCITTIAVAERKDGIPKTATMTIRSIESIMREKENNKRKNMSAMLETMSDGFFIYLADSEERLIYANPRVVHLFGCRTAMEFKELTSNTFPGLVHPDDIKRVQWEIHSQVKESDRSMDYIRYRIIRKDGEVRWIDDVGHLETSEYIDGPKMFYVFILDVTDEMTEAEKAYLMAESDRFNK